MKSISLISLLAWLLSSAAFAQNSNSPAPFYSTNPQPTEVSANGQDAAPQQMNQNTGQNNDMPLFRVNAYGRTTKAVNYRHRGGSTTVDLRGTELAPAVSGHAKVTGKVGRLTISAELMHLQPATSFGGQYLTYVLWAITPEGRAQNLGEILPGDNGKQKIEVTTDLQAFGLIVTAEPYYSVTRPSNEVVAENILRPETKGFEEPIDAKFDVLEGRQYTIDVPADQLPSSQANPTTPLDLIEARNAVAIAKAAGAERYAADSLTKAEDMLQRAEDYYHRKQGRTPIGTAARGATQMAEDARILTLRRIEQEKLDADRRAREEARQKAEAEAQQAQAQAAQAKAQADEDARRRAEAEQAQAAALAQQQRAQADAAAALAQQQQAQADAAAAREAREAAEREKEDADRRTREAIQQKEEMRARLLAQLNQVLQTRDTVRGLIVSMPDVLFDFNKYTLKPEARERLARISGIVLAYPDLKLQIEGYTDAIGSDEYNQTLSEKRAESVRNYLVSSGVNMNNVAAAGMGKADPVADNSTAEGRRRNRRVEMVVSGDVIGTQVAPSTQGLSATPDR